MLGWGVRCRLFHGLRPLLRSELLFDFRGDGIHIHLVDRSRIAESLCGVVAGGGQQDGDLNQCSAQRTFLGTAEPSREQLLNGVAVLGFFDAALTGNDSEAAFVEQRCQPLGNKQQVALHQPHRNGGGNGGKDVNAGGIGDGGLAALFDLLRLERGIGTARLLLGVMHRAIGMSADLVHLALLAALGDDGLGGVFARLVLRPLRLFLVFRLLIADGDILVDAWA